MAAEIGKDVRNFLVKVSVEDPLVLFGNILVKEKMEKIINAYIDKICKDIAPIYKKYDLFEKTCPFEELKKNMHAQVNYSLLPDEDY